METASVSFTGPKGNIEFSVKRPAGQRALRGGRWGAERDPSSLLRRQTVRVTAETFHEVREEVLLHDQETAEGNSCYADLITLSCRQRRRNGQQTDL